MCGPGWGQDGLDGGLVESGWPCSSPLALLLLPDIQASGPSLGPCRTQRIPPRLGIPASPDKPKGDLIRADLWPVTSLAVLCTFRFSSGHVY